MEDLRFNRPAMPEKTAAKGEEKTKIKKSRLVLFVLVSLAIIILAGAVVFLFLKSQKLQSEVKAAAANGVQNIVAEVSKLILLPADEEPMVATVQDPEKLRGQPFFANARDGYKVLIYTKARKAILYDPVNKIIVEVAPLNSGTP